MKSISYFDDHDLQKLYMSGFNQIILEIRSTRSGILSSNLDHLHFNPSGWPDNRLWSGFMTLLIILIILVCDGLRVLLVSHSWFDAQTPYGVLAVAGPTLSPGVHLLNPVAEVHLVEIQHFEAHLPENVHTFKQFWL